MVHAFYICIMVFVFIVGFLVGRTLDLKRRTIGRLILNLHDGSKELFEFHVTDDINFKDPPKQVVFDLSIPEGSEE